MMGRFDRAFEIAREAQQVANDTALPYDLSYARLAEGFTLFMRGSHPDAVIALEDSLSISRAAGILLLQPSVARYLGRAYAHCGRLQDAHALLDEAIGITKQQSLVGLTAWCSTARGVAHLIADSSESEQALQEAFDLAHRYGYHPVEVHALHALGCLYASRRGDALIKAERCLRDAAAKAEAMEMLPDLAQCLLALGGALRGQNRIADAENAEQRAAQTVYETNRNVLQQPGPSNIRTPGQPMTITH
jgi:tetratricopeptide (TPR) repeat protein